jgi:hypothetical protein
MVTWPRKLQFPITAFLLLAACQTSLVTPAIDPLATATVESDCDWGNAFPTEEAFVAWPSLLPIEVESVMPGDELEIVATGGYLRWDNECRKSINESAREFRVYIDDEPVGNISCFVNVCRVTITIPVDTSPGTHSLSVEGGSSLEIEVVDR